MIFGKVFLRVRQILTTSGRTVQSGDWVRLSNKTAFGDRLDDSVSFCDIWFPYAPYRRVARVVAVTDTTAILMIAGAQVRFPKSGFSPLRRWNQFLRRDRLGEWLIARDIASIYTAPRGQPRQPRADLPLVNALGGSYRNWGGFWGRQIILILLHWIGRLPLRDPWNGTGIQLQGCTAEMQFMYRDKERQFRLHQIRLHSNGNLLCLGKILPSGEARTFNIAEMSDLTVQGPMDPYHLRIELWALTMTKYAYAKKLTDHRAFAGLPPPPQPNFGDRVLGRCVEKLSRAHRRVKQKIAPYHLVWMKWQGGWYPPLGTILHRATLGRLRRLWRWHIVLTSYQATDWMRWRLAEWRGLPPPPQNMRRQSARWRRGLRVFADMLQRGQSIPPNAVITASLLHSDIQFARAMLRAMLQKVAQDLPDDDKDTIAQCLAICPPHRVIIRRQERLFADEFHDLMMVNHPSSERRRWKNLRRARESVTGRLICVYLVAYFGLENHWAFLPDSQYRPQSQAISRSAFRAALLLFAANWQGDKGQFDESSVARLRWLADFNIDQSQK